MWENYVCMYGPYVWMDVCMAGCDACDFLYAYMLACDVMCCNVSKDVGLSACQWCRFVYMYVAVI